MKGHLIIATCHNWSSCPFLVPQCMSSCRKSSDTCLRFVFSFALCLIVVLINCGITKFWGGACRTPVTRRQTVDHSGLRRDTDIQVGTLRHLPPAFQPWHPRIHRICALCHTDDLLPLADDQSDHCWPCLISVALSWVKTPWLLIDYLDLRSYIKHLQVTIHVCHKLPRNA